MELRHVGLFRVKDVSLLSAAGTTFVLVKAGTIPDPFRVLPQFCYVLLKTLTGALTTAPSIRIGSNAGHNNIAPLFTPPLTVTAGSIASLPLAAPLKAPSIDAVDLVIEIAAPAVGPSVITCDVLFQCLVL